MRTWLGLQPGSSGLRSGLNGRDKGGAIPLGASISGEPSTLTLQSNVVLVAGSDRSGFGMPATGWPNGCGYTHYKWRLDAGAWSAERTIATPIVLPGLAKGAHYVEISGKRDSGLYQDDPLFGVTAGVTRSRTWTVTDSFQIDSFTQVDTNSFQIQFTAEGNIGYTIQYRDSFSAGSWLPLVHLDPIPTPHPVSFTDTPPPGTPARFYRLSV